MIFNTAKRNPFHILARTWFSLKTHSRIHIWGGVRIAQGPFTHWCRTQNICYYGPLLGSVLSKNCLQDSSTLINYIKFISIPLVSKVYEKWALNCLKMNCLKPAIKDIEPPSKFSVFANGKADTHSLALPVCLLLYFAINIWETSSMKKLKHERLKWSDRNE